MIRKYIHQSVKQITEWVLNVIDFNKLIRRHHNQVFTLDKETKAQNGIKGPGTCPGI